MSRYTPETQTRQLEKIYGQGFQVRPATREEILSQRSGETVANVTPARIQWLIQSQSNEDEFSFEDNLPTEAQLREKMDLDVETLMDQVYEETGIENDALLSVLARMPADIYEVFMDQWLVLVDRYNEDIDYLLVAIDKHCIRADGTIRLVKLKRLMKEAKATAVKKSGLFEQNED